MTSDVVEFIHGGEAMARLDRQLDKLSGEKLVRLHWPKDDSVDIEMLRAELVREINAHSHRVPLDLRGVKGAPEELVELLLDMDRYARTKDKILSLTWILPPLREALDERVGRCVKASRDANGEAASQKARELLNYSEKNKEYDLSHAEKIQRKDRPRLSKTAKRRYVRLAAIVFASTLIIATIEIVFLFQQDTIVVVPEKGFE